MYSVHAHNYFLCKPNYTQWFLITKDMQVMSSCKQNHVLFIACNHGNWNVIMCIHDSFLTAHTPNSVVLVNYVVK